MSKLIEELSTVPEWNVVGGFLKKEFALMEEEKLDNLDKDDIEHILYGDYTSECVELVARLVMIKIREEWRQEGQDEFDRFVSKLKSVSNG